MKTICPDCNMEVSNLGAHRYQKHREKSEDKPSISIDNHLQDKQLSSIISDLKNILKQYSYGLTVKTVETNGTASEIEIIARIQPRR